MASPIIWLDTSDSDNMRILVYKKKTFYSAPITEGDPEEWEERLADAEDFESVLGKDCQVAPLDDVTRFEIILNGLARIHYGDDEGKAKTIELTLHEGSQKLLDLAQKVKPDWELNVVEENRFLAALKVLAICFAFAVFFVVMYFLIAFEYINRTHWLIALIVNICGPLPLLIIGGLFILAGMGGGVLAFLKPTETHVLEP